MASACNAMARKAARCTSCRAPDCNPSAAWKTEMPASRGFHGPIGWKWPLMTILLTGTEAGLVAYYPFSEGTGTATADLTGNVRPGTLVNNPKNDDPQCIQPAV